MKKILGSTSDAVAAVTAYNPGEGWSVVLAPESPGAPIGAKSAKK